MNGKIHSSYITVLVGKPITELDRAIELGTRVTYHCKANPYGITNTTNDE
jgi:hypothetical protein